MSIPNEVVDAVRGAVDVVELVGRSVSLKRSGGHWAGLCPFHQEKSPSFHVKRDRFHCYGCGESGSGIDWMMKREGLGFVDSVKRLAREHNIPVPERELTAEERRALQLRGEIYAVNAKYAAWCHLHLLRSPAAAGARELLKRMGVNSEMAKVWGLGYAPDDLGKFRWWAKEQGLSEAALVAAGILGKSERGGQYLRFRDRVMLPVRLEDGNVAAFMGLAVSEDAKTPWIQSGENAAFRASRVMYGWDKAKRGVCREQKVRLLTNPFLTMLAHDAGDDLAVMPLGQLSEWCAGAVKRVADAVVLCGVSEWGVRWQQWARVSLKAGLWVLVEVVEGERDEVVCPDVFEFLVGLGGEEGLAWCVELLKAMGEGAMVLQRVDAVRCVASGFGLTVEELEVRVKGGAVKPDANAMLLARWGVGRGDALRELLAVRVRDVDALVRVPELAVLKPVLGFGGEVCSQVMELPVVCDAKVSGVRDAVVIRALMHAASVLKVRADGGCAASVKKLLEINSRIASLSKNKD